MFNLHQSNRLENLFDALCSVIAEPQPDPLAAEYIVVQNPGMAQWLSRMIALRTGISANIQFPLPARFMWDIFESQLDLQGDGRDFDRPVLLWRILGLLPELAGREGFHTIDGYLRDDSDGRKAYQLADRISNLFDQYLVYRPDMLLEWEKGNDRGWQAELWRTVAGRDSRHRARLIQELRKGRRNGIVRSEKLPARVCLFAISSLAPVYLEMIECISEVIDIHLLHLSPCRHYWEDISSEREMARKRASWRQQQKTDVSEYYLGGNPLLASLGTVGREFVRQLAEYELHELEYYDGADNDFLLGMLQNDILELTDRSSREDGKTKLPDNDRSVQFHVCHSRQREVQVLHDRLLELFESHRELQPGEILVMAPDIEEYAPAVRAVFNAAAEDRAIPWSLADRSLHDEQPLARAFLTLLNLPASRMTAFEVVSLLETPAIQRRYSINTDELQTIRTWLRESGIRWGFDAAHRDQFGLEMSDLHSWSFGLNRLLLGYICGHRTDLYGGIAPSPGIAGADGPLLGELATFIENLHKWHQLLMVERPAAEWAMLLQQLLEDFFATGPGEADEDFLIVLRETVAELHSQCRHACYDRPMSRAVVTSRLEQALSSSPAGQPFLSGRVTFCNMVPMRSVPFRVICLLGMNDTDYPRSQQAVPFDLMADNPQTGDRNRRNDDCYLFLEALLSARDVFYLSWTGRDQRDNSIRPPSVVVDGLRDYIKQSFTAGDRSMEKILTVEHPLQPFSRRCFDGSPGTGSYAREWLPERVPVERRFLARSLPEADDEWRRIDSARLIRFWSHPVRFFLQERLGLRLREDEEHLDENEPFAFDGLERYHLVHNYIRQRLAGGDRDDFLTVFRAEGKLPHGNIGLSQYRECISVSEQFVSAVLSHTAEALEPVEVNCRLGSLSLAAWLGDLYRAGCIRYRPAKLHSRDILALWIHHLLLNYAAPEDCALRSLHVALDRTVCLRPVQDPEAGLWVLVEHYWQGLCEPLHFFPATSFAWQLALRKENGREMTEALRCWHGNWNLPGEGEDLACRIALKGLEPLDHSFEQLAAAVCGPILDHLEDVDAEV